MPVNAHRAAGPRVLHHMPGFDAATKEIVSAFAADGYADQADPTSVGYDVDASSAVASGGTYDAGGYDMSAVDTGMEAGTVDTTSYDSGYDDGTV